MSARTTSAPRARTIQAERRRAIRVGPMGGSSLRPAWARRERLYEASEIGGLR